MPAARGVSPPGVDLPLCVVLGRDHLPPLHPHPVTDLGVRLLRWRPVPAAARPGCLTHSDATPFPGSAWTTACLLDRRLVIAASSSPAVNGSDSVGTPERGPLCGNGSPT